MLCPYTCRSWSLHWKESLVKPEMSCTMRYLLFIVLAVLTITLPYIYGSTCFVFFVVQNMCMRVSKQLLIWTQEQAYWVASRFLTLGFELDLYSPGEYCMVYWYMYVVFTKLIEKMQLRVLSSSETCKFWALVNYPDLILVMVMMILWSSKPSLVVAIIEMTTQHLGWCSNNMSIKHMLLLYANCVLQFDLKR